MTTSSPRSRLLEFLVVFPVSVSLAAGSVVRSSSSPSSGVLSSGPVLCSSVPVPRSCASSWSSSRALATGFPCTVSPGCSELEPRHPQGSCRTPELHAVQGELEGQESPKIGRQVQQFRATVTILPPPAAVQNSEGQSHEAQMGGPGPRGHHLGTGALVLSPGRSESMATGTTTAGGVMSLSSTWPRSSRSTQAPLGPEDQRGTDGDGASSLPGGGAEPGSTRLGFKCFHFKGTGCLLNSGQRFREDPSGSLHAHSRPVLGETYANTPMVVPTRAWLDEVRKFMRRLLHRPGFNPEGSDTELFCNDYKVSVYGRKEAIWRFEQKLKRDPVLRETLWTMSGLRLICHCKPTQECHGDAIIREFRQQFPGAFDREASASEPLSSRVLNYLALLREEPESEADTSPDEGAPPKSTGWRGNGAPMVVGVGYTSREFCDGQSLASPGRWPVQQRRYPGSPQWKEVTDLFMSYAERHGEAPLLLNLAVGRVEQCPFDPQSIRELKKATVEALKRHGLELRRKDADRTDLPIDYRYLDLLLRAAGDPEVHLGSFAEGVRVGPGARLPRLPALYARKKKWRLPEQADPLDYQEEKCSTERIWRRNYASVSELTDKVLAVMEDQAERGQVLKFTEREARERYPNLVVASLGANRKDKPGGVVSARVLFDGTHGISVNTRTRIRDQKRAPIAADIKRSMREKSEQEEKTFALTADVSEAHRQIPIAPEDWHLLACQVEQGSTVYVNTVGTFGMASASYYWSRVAGALGRLSQYLAGHRASTWHMLVADDFHLEAGGPSYRPALIVFFALCAVCGVPLSWNKTAGGDTVAWVGFELLHRSYKLGISRRRAEWFIRWTREVAATDYVLMSNFEEGLGRIMYVAGALEFEKPFLAPLYKFLNLHPRDAVRRIPAYVSFILQYLAMQVEEERHYSCAAKLRPAATAPRVDAQASGERTGVGGWLPALDEHGVPDPSRSPWFSLEVKKEHWPWVYAMGDKPALVISTLEALAVLLAMKTFFGGERQGHHTKVQIMPTWTDNRGDGSALNKMMTTRYQASAVIMEMSVFMKRHGLKALVEWTPRAGNREVETGRG